MKRRYTIQTYSAAPGTGKCYECMKQDYTKIIVDHEHGSVSFADKLLGIKPQAASIMLMCDACAARFAIEILELLSI